MFPGLQLVDKTRRTFGIGDDLTLDDHLVVDAERQRFLLAGLHLRQARIADIAAVTE